jgi:hypothetical protein
MLMFSDMNLARCRDRSVSGHSVTIRETLSACSVELCGATAYEVSGNSKAHIVYFFLLTVEIVFRSCSYYRIILELE